MGGLTSTKEVQQQVQGAKSRQGPEEVLSLPDGHANGDVSPPGTWTMSRGMERTILALVGRAA